MSKVLSDVRGGDKFDFVGISKSEERFIEVHSISVDGMVFYTIHMAGEEPGVGSIPYDRMLVLIEQGIWKERKG